LWLAFRNKSGTEIIIVRDSSNYTYIVTQIHWQPKGVVLPSFHLVFFLFLRFELSSQIGIYIIIHYLKDDTVYILTNYIISIYKYIYLAKCLPRVDQQNYYIDCHANLQSINKQSFFTFMSSCLISISSIFTFISACDSWIIVLVLKIIPKMAL
jgi:hypothetical protein